VSIESLGYYKYNQRLCLQLGLDMTTITKVFYKQQDKGCSTDQKYSNKPERRKLCAQQRLENINKECRKEVIDKQSGNTYRLAMMAPTVLAMPSSLELARLTNIMIIRVNQAGYV
jgi:hypothetical protein